MKQYSSCMGPHDVWNWQGEKTAGYVNLQMRMKAAIKRLDEAKADRVDDAWFAIMAKRVAQGEVQC